MISPVSFRASQDFNQMISKPQSYTTTPQAAAGLSDGKGKSHKAGKVILTIAAVAAALGGLAYAASKGKLNPKEGGNKFIEKAKEYAKIVGDTVYKAYSTVKGMVIKTPKKRTPVRYPHSAAQTENPIRYKITGHSRPLPTPSLIK